MQYYKISFINAFGDYVEHEFLDERIELDPIKDTWTYDFWEDDIHYQLFGCGTEIPELFDKRIVTQYDIDGMVDGQINMSTLVCENL